MSSRFQTRSRKPIQPLFRSVPEGGGSSIPGSPIYIGDRAPSDAIISLIQYDQHDASFVTPDHVEEILAMLEDGMVNWVNVNGLGDQDLVKQLGGFFRLDSLTIEDILNTEHRPKVEDFGHYLLVITKMLNHKADGSIEYEQVGMVLTRNAVLTFQENPGDCFGAVRERIRAGTGRIRRLGAGYLAYALVDVIVDNYFVLLERLGDRLEDMETASVSARTAVLSNSFFLWRSFLFYSRFFGGGFFGRFFLIQYSIDNFVEFFFERFNFFFYRFQCFFETQIH